MEDEGETDWWQAAAAQAGGDILGSVVNNLWYQSNLDKQYAQNKKMYDYTFSKNLEMWHTQNQYNSPAAQMERLNAAGLNPNLVYGKGAVGNTSGPIPQHGTPHKEAMRPDIRIPEVLSYYNDYRLKQAQIDNLNAQKNLTDQRTQTEAVNRAWRALLTEKEDWKWYGGWYSKAGKVGEMTAKYDTWQGDKYHYATFRKADRALKGYSVDIAAERQKLLEEQIRQARIMTQIRNKDLNWYNVTHGVNVGAKALGSAAGAAFGLSKLGKVGKASKPYLKQPSRRPGLGSYNNNSDIKPNYDFYR